MEKNLPHFDLGFGYLFPPVPEEKKQKKEELQRFACLDDRELAKAKSTKYAVNVFQVNFCI